MTQAQTPFLLTLSSRASVVIEPVEPNGLEAFVSQYQARIEAALLQFLPTPVAGAERLHEAMRYSLLAGGKRVRPLLVLASSHAVSSVNDACWPAVAAIEYIHTYSLVHDDLPSMDDDKLRRGKPTCHMAYDEATAILAGDALQCAAFECLSLKNVTLPMITYLARAAGAGGMVAGQAIDMAAVDQSVDLTYLSHMHRNKTGALIRASVQMGALAGGASSSQLSDLERYAEAIGLAFQIQDDILDVTAETQILGKQQGADAAANKPTYVSLLGLEGAKQKAQETLDDALAALSTLPNRQVLADLARYIVRRDR